MAGKDDLADAVLGGASDFMADIIAKMAKWYEAADDQKVLNMCVSVSVRIHMLTYCVCVHICMYVTFDVFMYICIRTYVYYMHAYMYMCMYVAIYIECVLVNSQAIKRYMCGIKP